MRFGFKLKSLILNYVLIPLITVCWSRTAADKQAWFLCESQQEPHTLCASISSLRFFCLHTCKFSSHPSASACSFSLSAQTILMFSLFFFFYFFKAGQRSAAKLVFQRTWCAFLRFCFTSSGTESCTRGAALSPKLNSTDQIKESVVSLSLNLLCCSAEVISIFLSHFNLIQSQSVNLISANLVIRYIRLSCSALEKYTVHHC